MLPTSTDVAIVGAGPTGLVLANQLAMRGIDFVAIDRLARHENTSRAAVVHARTLEALEAIDAAKPLLDRGVRVPVFTIRDRDRALLTIDFSILPTQYPFTLMIPQGEIEDIFESRLQAQGAKVHRQIEIEDVVQDATGAALRLKEPNGSLAELRAKYVVGADGAHSVVRGKAGIAFDGGSYAQWFILADVRMDWDYDRREVMLFFAPDGLVVVAPLPGNRHRIVATVDRAAEHPSLGDFQKILDARGPAATRARIREVVWSSCFHVHHRVADRFRSGHLVLAGDAAHIHSPAGGQGMNTGIQDACALGSALADALGGHGRTDPLEVYERLRRPVALNVVRLTDRLTRVATLRGRAQRWIRNVGIRAVGQVPAFRRSLAMQLSELSER